MPNWKSFEEAVAEIPGSKHLRTIIQVKGPVHVPSPKWDPRAHNVDLVAGNPLIQVHDEAQGWIPANLHPPKQAEQARGLCEPPSSEFRTKTRSILFMDVSGWSRLKAAEIHAYVIKAMPSLAEHLQKPDFLNTWGDAIVATFESAKDAAEAALNLRDFFRRGYAHEGMGGLACRISLHTGEAIIGFNALTRHEDIFGEAVHIAARLEPATAPGHVFCTKSFAERLDEIKGSAPRTWQLGTVDLPKGFGAREVLTVTWPGEPDPGLRHQAPQLALDTQRAEPDLKELGVVWPVNRALSLELRTSATHIAVLRNDATRLELPLRILNCAPFPVKVVSLRLKWCLRLQYDSSVSGRTLEDESEVYDEFKTLDSGSCQDIVARIQGRHFVGEAAAHMFLGSGGELVGAAAAWGGMKRMNIGSQLWGTVLDERTTT
jgi:class 3 adenylate cyclase